MSSPRLRRVVSCCATALAVVLVPAACSDSGSNVTASAESEERGSSEDAGGGSSTGDEDYCAALERLASDGTDVDLTEDPDAALAEVRSLADTAPPELEADFEVFVATIERLASIPADDSGEALGELFEVMLDPEFMEAQERIDDYSGDECGIDFDDLGTGSDLEGLGDAEPGDDDLGSGMEDDPTDISLEDIDAIEEANDGTAWEEKLSSTVISMGADVQLGSGPDAFTVDEAIEMCTIMLDTLSAKNADVTVSVSNGETVIVDTSGGSCAEV